MFPHLISKKDNFLSLELQGKKQKFFDFSSSLSGEVFGYGSSIYSRSIKKNLKWINRTRSNCSTDFLRNHLEPLYRKNPSLGNFYVYMLDQTTWDQFVMSQKRRLFFLDFELEEEAILKSFKGFKKEASTDAEVMMSDLYFQFHHGELPPKTTLWVNATFPRLEPYASLPEIENIMIAGNHPMNLGGYRLFFSREKELFDHRVSLFHLCLYQTMIRKYFFFLARDGAKLNDQVEQGLNLLKDCFRIENSKDFSCLKRLSFKDPLCLKHFRHLSDDPYRYFSRKSTFIYHEFVYLFLPISTPINHLKSKWKDLIKL